MTASQRRHELNSFNRRLAYNFGDTFDKKASVTDLRATPGDSAAVGLGNTPIGFLDSHSSNSHFVKCLPRVSANELETMFSEQALYALTCGIYCHGVFVNVKVLLLIAIGLRRC